jgi:hypothetical protein
LAWRFCTAAHDQLQPGGCFGVDGGVSWPGTIVRSGADAGVVRAIG